MNENLTLAVQFGQVVSAAAIPCVGDAWESMALKTTAYPQWGQIVLRVRTHNQNMTVAAIQMAERKSSPHLS